MLNTYTIPMSEYQTVEKAISRFQKKADAYGNTFKACYGLPYAKKRAIYEEVKDDVTHTVEYKKIGEELIEVFDLSLECDIVRKDGYSIVAKLEHFENGNFVYSFTDDRKECWQTLESACDHCRTKHYRKNTFIVRNDDGTEKQVGSTCLKDYCGIDPNYFAQLKEIQDLIISDSFENFDFEHHSHGEKVYQMDEVLGLAIEIYDLQGYRKSDESASNKSVLHDRLIRRISPSAENIEKARKMLASISSLKSFDETFIESDMFREFDQKRREQYEIAKKAIEEITECPEGCSDLAWYKKSSMINLEENSRFLEDEDGNLITRGDILERWIKQYPYIYSLRKGEYLTGNIRTLALLGYCKDSHLGYIAFVPVAYERYVAALDEDNRRIEAKKSQAEISQHVGNVGEKIVVDVKEMKLVTSWENAFGYTYLYRIIDTAGNVLIWKASKCVNEFKRFKGTVKEHGERDGVKQTVVTRCFAVA